MKRSRLFFGVAVLAVLISSVITLWAYQRLVPPKVSQVAGAWVGYISPAMFWRLELETNGTGYLCSRFGTDLMQPALYRVESWSITNWTVKLKVRTIESMWSNPNEVPFTFGKVEYSASGGSDATATLEGEYVDNKGLTLRFLLYNERGWQTNTAATQERISKYRRENP